MRRWHCNRSSYSLCRSKYTDPVEELLYDSQEGGYQGSYFEDIAEVLEAEGLFLENEKLLNRIREELDGAFCEQDYYAGSSEDNFRMNWREFVHTVQHERRYTFWNLGQRETDWLDRRIAPGRMLAVLCNEVSNVIPEMTLGVGTKFWRVRVFDPDSVKLVADEYTSPPHEKAWQANRMSPAGIPMLYVADDLATAKAETVDESNKIKLSLAHVLNR